VDLVVAARVDEQRRAGVQRLLCVLPGRGPSAELPQAPEARRRQHEVVGELVARMSRVALVEVGRGDPRGVQSGRPAPA